MPLAFIAPWFLAGIALLAVPIAVHLINRERKQPVAFPSLMFLRQVPHRSVRRRRLRNLVLFALRCLAIVLLVAAFARPFVGRAGVGPGGGLAGREVVLLLDRSYSMGAGDRWTRATAAARRVVDALTPQDRATLVLFDEQPATVVQATSDRTSLAAALGAARVGSGATRYDPALALAAQVLATSRLPRREVVLVTDFQRGGWRGSDEARLPAGTALATVDVGAAAREGAGNVAVTGVDLARDVQAGRERVAPTARLVNAGGSAPRDVVAELEINGRVVESKSVRVEPNGAATVTFAPVPVAEGWSRGTVRAGQDALPADNAFHFAVTRGQVVSVLLAEGPGARADASLFLRRALAVGNRPPFDVAVSRAGTLRADDLTGRSVVILDDAPPDAATARLLAAHVRRGGGLLVVLGDASTARAWPGDATQLLPTAIGQVVDRSPQGGTRLAAVDRTHPVFAPFNAPRSGDLAAARVLRYRALEPAADASVLARFADGAPALVERAVARGRVVVWASTLDNFWSDLAVQPVFVPLVHQMTRHAAGYRDARPWLTVGQTLGLGAEGATTSAGWAVETPSGKTIEVTGVGGAAPALTVSEQGFYVARRPDAPEAPALTIAANLDAAEADPARVEPAEIVRAVAAGGGSRASAAVEAATLTREEQEQRQGLWWYLLVGALTLLAAETILSNRLSRAQVGRR